MESELDPGLVIFLVGLALLLFGVGNYLYRGYLLKDGLESIATIITTERRLVDRYDSGKVYMYFPILTYEVDGVQYINDKRSHAEPKFLDGQEIVILYDKDYPTNFHIKGEEAVDTTGLIYITVISALIIIIGFFFMLTDAPS